jgi:putative transposase
VGEVSYKGHRYPAEIIAHCVWLYHHFQLSFREVEELRSELEIGQWPEFE